MRRLPLLLLGLAACSGPPAPGTAEFYRAEARFRMREASSAESAGDPERALALYRMATDIEPRMAEAHLARARLYDGMGRANEAEQAYSSAVYVADDEWKARSHHARGNFLLRLGRHRPAVLDFDAAIRALGESDEWRAGILLDRAAARIGLMQWEAALADVQEARKSGASRAHADEIQRRIEKSRSEFPR